MGEASATDLEALLGTGISAAQEQLNHHRGFLPFALAMEHDGEVRLVAVSPPDANEGPGDGFDADSMISDLTEVLRQNRKDFRAAAIICDVTLMEERSDAIHMATEHSDGSVFAAVLPYSPHADANEWQFAQLIGDSNEPTIWVD